MKQLKVFTALLLVMLLMLTACSGKNEPAPAESADAEATADVAETTAPEKEETAAVSDKDLPIEYRLPGTDVVLNAPDYQQVENRLTRVFIDGEELCIAVTGDDFGNATELAEVHSEITALVFGNLSNYVPAESLEVSSDKTVTVNGNDVYYYEGTLHCEGLDLPAFGFTALVDGVQVSVLGYAGSVVNTQPDQSQIDRVKSNVEAMMQTLRVEA